MKKIIAVLVLMCLIFAGCGEATTDTNDTDKKPTSCAISDDATDNGGEGDADADTTINLNPKNGLEALENGLKALKAVDEEGIIKYFGADFWQWSFDVGENKLALIKRALPQMEYEIVNVEESEYGGIYGTVKFTAIDIGMEWVDVQQRLEDWYQAMALEDLPITDEGRTGELYRIFNSELDDTSELKYKTSEVTIEAWCSLEGYWTLSRSDELLRAIFGTVTWGEGMA